MTSVSGDPAAPPVHLYDRRKSIPKLVLSPQLQEFIFAKSDIKAMRECSDRYPCMRRPCPWCASRIAAKTRRQTRDIASGFEAVVEVTLTTETLPTLAASWEAQGQARAKFMSNSWLTKNSSAWLRETELTVDERGWHVHDHYLLFLDSNDWRELGDLGQATVARWLDMASRAGVRATPKGQHSRAHRGTRERLLYVTKGLMRQKGNASELDGYSGADVLAMYVAGEVRGLEWWTELEAHFSIRRRWRARGGAFAVVPEQHDQWTLDQLLDGPSIPWPKSEHWDPNLPRDSGRTRRMEASRARWDEDARLRIIHAEIEQERRAERLQWEQEEEARLARQASMPPRTFPDFSDLLP